jgi:hypothetical protein
MCAARVRTERLTMFGWGAFFSLWGVVQDACCCGHHSPLIAASPSVLLQNNLHCFVPCCSWCGRPQAPGGAGVEQGQPPTLQTSQTSCSPNSQRPWHCQWCPRLSCRWQWRLWTPHTQPLDLMQHVIFLFPPQGSWFSPSMQACCGQAAFVPHPTANSQPREQSLLCSFVLLLESRPGGPGRGLC